MSVGLTKTIGTRMNVLRINFEDQVQLHLGYMPSAAETGGTCEKVPECAKMPRAFELSNKDEE